MTSELPAGWQQQKVGDLVENHDKRRVPLSSRARQKRQGPYPYWGANGVLDHVDDFLFEGPHILIAEDGTVERSDGRAVVHWVSGQFWVNNHAHILRAVEGVDQRWLYYALRDVRIAPFLTGSVQLKLTQGNLKQIPLAVPPLDEQTRIASVLAALDDKIAVERRLSSTIEAIGDTEYRARFVRFLDADELTGSELGRIPAGWKVGGLSDIATVTMGQSPPSSTYSNEESAGPAMVQGKGAFGPRFPKADVFCSAPTRMAAAGDLLMTVRAPVGDLNVCDREICLGRGVAGFSSSDPGFLEFTLRSATHRWRAHESGTIYSAVNKSQVEEFPVVVPPEEALAEFERLITPLRERLSAAHRQIADLTNVRDGLLSRLVSGRTRVEMSDASLAGAT